MAAPTETATAPEVMDDAPFEKGADEQPLPPLETMRSAPPPPSKFAFINKVNNGVGKSIVGKYFKIEERNSTFVREMRAGLTTFICMAYILAVSSGILTDSGGPCSAEDCTPVNGVLLGGPDDGGWCIFNYYPLPPSDPGYGGPNPGYAACLQELRSNLVVAVAGSSCFSCVLMGVTANLPIALSTGMGINAYFAYTVVGYRGTGNVSYETALTAVFIEGWIFFILAITGLRLFLATCVPEPVKIATGVGIGLFLSMIGLQASEGVGLVTMDLATLVTLGGCPRKYSTPVATIFTYPNGTRIITGPTSSNYVCQGHKLQSATLWLGVAGFVLICWAQKLRISGSVLLGVLFVTIISWIPGSAVSYLDDTGNIPGGEARWEVFKQVVSAPSLSLTGWQFDWAGLKSGDAWVALITFLYVDLFDATGTMYAMAKFAGMLDERGSFPGQMAAFSSDALGIVVGATMGVSPITAFIESAAGIREGARTGIAAIVVGMCFFIALFFSPILSNIPPYATGPALVVIGSMMMGAVIEIKWWKVGHCVPAFIAIVFMPALYSIAYGLIASIGAYIVLNVPEYVYWKFIKKQAPPEDVLDEPKQGFKTKALEEVSTYHDSGIPQLLKDPARESGIGVFSGHGSEAPSSAPGTAPPSTVVTEPPASAPASEKVTGAAAV